MSTQALTRDEAIRRLLSIEAEIRRLGVRRLALFGSVLRNEARPDSDVDVLVEFIPSEKTFDRFMALADLLEETLGHPVEVVTTEALSPYIGPHILAEATDVLRAA
jgi:predicted nucleotidyltransferase